MRFGRNQEIHLKITRSTRDIVHEDWKVGAGRPKGLMNRERLEALNISRLPDYEYMKLKKYRKLD